MTHRYDIHSATQDESCRIDAYLRHVGMPKEPAKSIFKGPRPKRKLVDVGGAMEDELRAASEKCGEPITTVTRICLRFGLDALARADFKLHRLGSV